MTRVLKKYQLTLFKLKICQLVFFKYNLYSSQTNLDRKIDRPFQDQTFFSNSYVLKSYPATNLSTTNKLNGNNLP